MSEELPKLPSCPFCWDRKRKCIRDPITLQCQHCRPGHGNFQNHAIRFADTFYDAVAHAQLYKPVRMGSLHTLDIHEGSHDKNVFGLRIKTSAGINSDLYTHSIDAGFNIQNTLLVTWLKGIVREHFTLDIYGEGPYNQAVENAILAGGCIHLLCSSSRTIENVQTERDGAFAANEMEYYNLNIHFQDLILGLLRELINGALDTTRFEDPDGDHPEYTRAAYAAAVFLRYEVDYFKRNLRNGPLLHLSHVPAAWKGQHGILVNWFTTVEAELLHYLRRGCGYHPDWDKALTAKRDARRQFETFELELYLQQVKYTMPIAPTIVPIYTQQGDGDVCMTSPPTTPTLKVLGLSKDVLDEEDKRPTHVPYPALLDDSSTEAGTSEMDLDLFPDLARYIR